MSSGVNDPRIIVFTVPPSLNTPVFGTDAETSLSFFNVLSPNVILRMIEDLGEDDTRQYSYDFIRDNKVVRTIPGNLMKSTLPGPVWLPFPITIGPGIFQVQMRQTVTGGGLQARNVNVIYDHALGV